MQAAQLICPHCGSSLNFGMAIAAGSPVECLICMRSFVAEASVSPVPLQSSVETNRERSANIDTVEIPSLANVETQSIPKTSPMPPAPKVLIATSSNTAASATVEKSSSKTPLPLPKAARANPKPERKSIDAPAEPAGNGNGATLAAVAFGLFLLLIGGTGLVIWQIAGPNMTDPATPPSVAANAKPDSQDNSSESAPLPTPNPVEPINGNDIKQQIDPNDDDEKRQAKEAEKKLLTRKTPASGAGSEPGFDAVATFNIQKQTAWGLDQDKINAAIEKGLVYLKSTQLPTGTWSTAHSVGFASIGGLTYLECGVPATDPCVQKSAAYVRNHTADLIMTYELSLAVLFLDRLGDPRDRILIQTLALRLLAGQLEGGGWTYHCRKLESEEMYQLYAFLYSNKKPDFFDPLQGNSRLNTGITKNAALTNPIGKGANNLNDPFHQLSKLILEQAIENPSAQHPHGTAVTLTDPTLEPKKAGTVQPSAEAGNPPRNKSKMTPVRLDALKKILQQLPVVQNQGKKKGHQKGRYGSGDNSNTQFALLALWAARRHDLPTDPGLLASFDRFNGSQNNDGGWGYTPRANSTNSMTGVGLLGMAMGHGSSPDIICVNPNNPKEMIIKPALHDPKIQTGLEALAQHIGEPSFTKQTFPMQNLYFLWSVERVAMLYDLKTIGGKDWYVWGAQILVHNQQPDGAWPNSNYHGANPPLNTCFALLFLKRSNLVKDLTNNLRLQSGIANPDR